MIATLVRFFFVFIAILVAPFLGGCFPFGDGASSSSGDTNATHEERNVSGTVALALGGVAESADEIVFDEAFTVLELVNEDPELFSVNPRPSFPDVTSGRGAKLVALSEGIGYVTPKLNGRSLNPVEVIIPPQSLVQILMGECRGEMNREATIREGRVVSTSVSVTADAVAAVIRNRINLILNEEDPSLFAADPDRFEANPPVSYYDAVIEADNGSTYQFSPVDPDDPSQDIYQSAQDRLFVDEDLKTAYDQAVLTAAYIFNNDTQDPTDGAFGFYSPTPEEFDALEDAAQNHSTNLPAGGGLTDARFPALAPLQVVLLPQIAPSWSDTGTASFVFVRSRNPDEPAVVEE